MALPVIGGLGAKAGAAVKGGSAAGAGSALKGAGSAAKSALVGTPARAAATGFSAGSITDVSLGGGGGDDSGGGGPDPDDIDVEFWVMVAGAALGAFLLITRL